MDTTDPAAAVDTADSDIRAARAAVAQSGMPDLARRALAALAQRQPENACRQQHTANNEADDGSRPQGVPDPTQITKAGHVDNDDLSRVARAVVGRYGVADLRWPATRDCALASLCLALGVGVADRDVAGLV